MLDEPLLADGPIIDGNAMQTTPSRPIASPSTCFDGGALRTIAVATSAVNSGEAPLSIPITLLDTCCSANGNALNGTANQTMPSVTMPPHALLGIGARAFGNIPSVMNPISTRNGVTNPGENESIAMAMK